MEKSQVIDEVRHWLSTMVVGLGLCPFAEGVFKGDRIRYAVCDSGKPEAVLEALADELLRLLAAPRSECETTLLIAPGLLPDFLDFNDFVGVAEELVEDLKLAGTIQIVGFHPRFVFAETPEDAPKNYTNRSPFPLLHLLREESITEVSGNPEEMLEITRRNTATLNHLGITGILKRRGQATFNIKK